MIKKVFFLSTDLLPNSFFSKKSFLFFLCFGIFYLITVTVRPLGVPDEARYTSIAYQMYLSGDYISPMLNGGLFMDKPALYYWLEAFSMHLFGVNNLALRIPPLLLGLASLFAVCIAGYRFFNATTAWIATFILGTSPCWFMFSQYANMDIEVASWITLTLITSLIALHTSFGTKRRFIFYLAYALAALATLTKGMMGIIFPLIIIGVYSLLTRQWKLIKHIYLPSGLIIYLAICLPWFILMQNKHPEFFNYFFVHQQLFRYVSSGSFNNIQPFWFFAGIILLGLLPWSLVIVAYFLGKHPLKASLKIVREKESATLYLSLWFVILFIFFSIPASKPPGYILPVFAPLCLLIANYLADWCQHAKKDRWLKYSMVLFVFLGSILPLLIVMFNFKLAGKLDKVKLWLFIISFTGILFSLTALLCKKRLQTIMSLLLFPAVLCLCLPFIIKQLDKRSLEPFLTTIHTFITPQTTVVNYDKYFYDLPLILKRKDPIVVVSDWNNEKKIMRSDNWRRSLYLGMKSIPAAKSWLLTYDEFDQLLNTTNKPVIIFAKNHDKKQLIDEKKLHLIAELNDTIIVSTNNTLN